MTGGLGDIGREHRRFSNRLQRRKIVNPIPKDLPARSEGATSQPWRTIEPREPPGTCSLAERKRKNNASPARTHKLGIGSESLSTARRIAFHQRSCSSAVRQLRFWPQTEMRRSFRITLPICPCGIFFDFNSERIRSAFFGPQEMIMRDCASLNMVPHAFRAVEFAVSPAIPSCSPLQADKSIP